MNNYDNIPDGLKKLKIWILWRHEIDKDGRKIKPPYNVWGSDAKSNNENTWGTYEDAIKIISDPQCGYNGLGICITKGTNLVGFDLDHCVINGELTPDAEFFVEIANTYTEYSQSGSGLHIISYLPPGETPPLGIETSKKLHNIDYKEIEVCVNKFFYMTGDIYEGHNEISVNGIHREMIYYLEEAAKKPEKVKSDKEPEPIKTDLSVDGLIEFLNLSSAKFTKLFQGDYSDYPSQSEADLGFCNLIAKQTKDPDVIDQIMRQSGLYREKWNRDDYRNETIKKAIENAETSRAKSDTNAKKKQEQIEEPEPEITDLWNQITTANDLKLMEDMGLSGSPKG
jgi:primase-polymerase (primpol)-like protein